MLVVHSADCMRGPLVLKFEMSRELTLRECAWQALHSRVHFAQLSCEVQGALSVRLESSCDGLSDDAGVVRFGLATSSASHKATTVVHSEHRVHQCSDLCSSLGIRKEDQTTGKCAQNRP
jgi:hypothetical protein